jgi:hypothetical protein
MIGTKEAHEVVREKVLLRKGLSPQIGEIADRQIDVAVFEAILDLAWR